MLFRSVPLHPALQAIESDVLAGRPAQIPNVAQTGEVPGITHQPGTFNPAFNPTAPTTTPFTEHAPTTSPGLTLPVAEQGRRLRVLNEIGLNDPTAIRESALTGDPLSAGTDGQIARLESDAGRHMKGVILNERTTLNKYANDTVSATNGRAEDRKSTRLNSSH